MATGAGTTDTTDTMATTDTMDTTIITTTGAGTGGAEPAQVTGDNGVEPRREHARSGVLSSAVHGSEPGRLTPSGTRCRRYRRRRRRRRYARSDVRRLGGHRARVRRGRGRLALRAAHQEVDEESHPDQHDD